MSPESRLYYIDQFKRVETELLLAAVLYEPENNKTVSVLVPFYTTDSELIAVYYSLRLSRFTRIQVVNPLGAIEFIRL